MSNDNHLISPLPIYTHTQPQALQPASPSLDKGTATSVAIIIEASKATTNMDNPSGHGAASTITTAGSPSGAATPWMLFLFSVFSIPLVFLVALSLPLPPAYRRKIRHGILAALNRLTLLRFEYAGAAISLIAIIVIIAFLGLVFSAKDSMNTRQQESQALFLAEKKELRCKRWRSERNFWISVLGCVLWIVLIRIQTLLQDAGPMEEKLLTAQEDRDKAVAELQQKESVIKRLQDAVDADSRQLKDKDETIRVLKQKADDLVELQKKVAKLEIANENLSRESKKTT